MLPMDEPHIKTKMTLGCIFLNHGDHATLVTSKQNATETEMLRQAERLLETLDEAKSPLVPFRLHSKYKTYFKTGFLPGFQSEHTQIRLVNISAPWSGLGCYP